jgi:2',3'-cyclic-nucleotide 2'-phosphodiesterase (5'-nucleotidase family)
VVAHVGTRCRDFHPHGSLIHTQDTSFVDCDEKGELTQFIKKIPLGKIDAIVSGHTHTLLHHYIEGIPVIQAGAYNRYYNLIRLVYDSKSKKSVPSLSKIEGPFPICKKIFSNQKDCDGDRAPPPEGRGNLVTPTLYGETIEPDPAIIRLLEPYRKKTDALKKTVVGHASRPLTHDRRKESELGNLIADALLWISNADFSLVNPGGIRAPIPSGNIYYEDVYRSFPFDNRLSILKVTGKELKLILQIAQNGSRGWFSVGNLALDLISLDKPGKIKDLNHNGKHENWETNRLKGVRELKTGKKIDDRKIYTLATLDFLVTGGDGLGWIMKQIPQSRIKLDTGISVRDALIEYLKTKNTVNSSTEPLVNPQSPRIRIVVK